MDHRNRNEEKCNLPQSEVLALKELVRFQRERVITIKACDKGAGIIILDFKAYMTACYNHLLEKQPNTAGEETPKYYKKEDDFALDRARSHIQNTLKEALKENIITKEEYKFMDPEDKNASKFYCNFKVHKKHMHKETPPPRPIISGSGSVTENVSLYVEHDIKNISTKHASYLQDTPHFLRVIDKVNKGPKLPSDTMLVTSDITGAYQNIPQDDGSKCLNEALEERSDKAIPSNFIVKLMDLVQKHNIFEFHDSLWRQTIGVAMGIHPAPSFANIYLSRRIDNKLIELGEKYGKDHKSAFIIFKRFLDDLFKIFRGTTKQLHNLFSEMNEIHPTLKFTLDHTSPENEKEEDKCDCPEKKSIPFLDTSLSIKNGKIEVDLFRKETDRNQYLLPSSCHPKSTTASIPFSLSLRIVRICTNTLKRDIRLAELKQLLLARNYPEPLIDSAVTKARKIPRKIALLKVKDKKSNSRPVFVVKYDPRLPPIETIQAKHWRSMTGQNKYLKEVFKEPPMTAYRRQNNLRDILIKAKVPPAPARYPSRKLKGMNRCGKNCTACPYISTVKEVKVNHNETWHINKPFNCETYNCIYMLDCKRCGNRYIGETGRMIKARLSDHRVYINNQVIAVTTGDHFNLPGHSLADLQLIILEQVKKEDETYRKEREKYFINKFNTFYGGLNREM